jgi:hypothetical protein
MEPTLLRSTCIARDQSLGLQALDVMGHGQRITVHALVAVGPISLRFVVVKIAHQTDPLSSDD